METKLEQIAVKAVNQLPRAWCGKSARHVLWEPGAGDRLRRPGRCENGDMVEPVRHRRTKGAETDMFEPKATASHLDSTQSGHSSKTSRSGKCQKLPSYLLGIVMSVMSAAETSS